MLRSLRNFIVSLLISGVVFGAAAYYLSGILIECLGPLFGVSAENHLSVEKDEIEKEEDDITIPEIEVETSFSMLLITTNYKPSLSGEYNPADVARYPKNEDGGSNSQDTSDLKRIEATDFVILRGSSQKKEFTYTYLPASLQVNIKGRTMTLGEVYRDLGVTLLSKKISALTGFDFDSYAIYDLEDISYIVDYIDGVKYNVPTDIKDGENIILGKGSKTIKGTDAITLIEYQGYASNTRSQMMLTFIKSMMAKITNKVYKVDITALHRSSSGKVDTTATVTAVGNITPLLYNYTTLSITDLTYPGTYRNVNGKTVFVPNVAAAVSNFSHYR